MKRERSVAEEYSLLVQALENLNLEVAGSDALENYPKDGSLRGVVDSILLIKSDIFTLLSEKKTNLAEIERETLQSEKLKAELVEALEYSEAFRIAAEKETEWNLKLTREAIESQKELVFILGEIIESRSRETANHIRRVSEYCALLASLCGMKERESVRIFHAAPLHDAGKIGIPDAILNKPGKLTAGEFDIMKSHTMIGKDILDGSKREILRAGSIIAHEHHERWNGSGYPRGLLGNEIHIYGRIAALADVFDALGSKRCYKDAWPLEKILELIRNEKGKHFDPNVVCIFRRT